MRKILFIPFMLLLLSESKISYTQGCSDAGFCTIGNLATAKPGSSPTKKHSLALLLPIGVGDENVFVFTPAIEYKLQLSPAWGLQARLTANYASGELGNALGLGDVYLAGTYTFKPSAKWRTSITAGTKLPLNQGNLKEENLSLPMQYQSSLGTIDFITGIAVMSNHWQFAAGWQQPVSGINRNNFLPAYWNKPSAMNYPPSNDFNRKGDVLLRAAYAFAANRTWQFNTGLLAIYHLGEDTYIDANISNSPISIAGSEGLTLNATASVMFQVNNRIHVGVSGGTPLVARDVRPDGLTRKFVIAPEIKYNF